MIWKRRRLRIIPFIYTPLFPTNSPPGIAEESRIGNKGSIPIFTTMVPPLTPPDSPPWITKARRLRNMASLHTRNLSFYLLLIPPPLIT